MTKLIILALVASSSLFAQEILPVPPVQSDAAIEGARVMNGGMMDTPALVTEDITIERIHNPRKSHWLSTFGFEGSKYDVPFSFSGQEKSFKPNQQELWGGRIGFGGEIYLGAGFNTVSKVEGYYMGTLFSRVLNAGPEDDDIEFAYSKRTGHIYGVDASQSIGFMFDMKTKNPFMDEWAYLTVEPYVEAGIGMARAYNRVNYSYDTGPGNVQERYKSSVNDELLNARIGAGINFTSTSGYFLFLKATVNRYDITERKTKTYTQANGTPGSSVETTDKNAKIDPVTVYAIGGGYKF